MLVVDARDRGRRRILPDMTVFEREREVFIALVSDCNADESIRDVRNISARHRPKTMTAFSFKENSLDIQKRR
jgi:hypothetical protein